MNYYRITAYHPAENVSAILDSHGRFEKLWEFSAYLVSKGFKILEASKEGGFLEGTMPIAPHNTQRIFVQACGRGKPTEGATVIDGTPYRSVVLEGKSYVPDGQTPLSKQA